MPAAAMRIAGKSKRSLTKRSTFNVTNLTAATCPPGKPRAYIFDLKTPALALLVTDKGAKSFYFVRRIGGIPKRKHLGGFPELSVEQARKIVATMQGKIADGKDPIAESRAISKSITLGELWDKWKSDHATPRLRSRTIITDQSRFDTCLGDWRSRRIGSIQEGEVRTKHSDVGKSRGHVTANRAIQLLRRLLYYARVEPNPAGKGAVDLFNETERERFISPDEMPRLFAALETEQNETIKDFILMSLWTAQRRSNVQSMRWDEIDFARGVWVVPSSKFKTGKALDVHLTGQALDILRRRYAAKRDSDYVFPGRGASGHLEEPKGAWKEICKRAGINNLTLHDLRRTAASWMAIGGASLPIIGAALGHKSAAATRIYARLHSTAVAASMDSAVAAMEQAGNKQVGK